MIRRPPNSTLFPSPPLFRSAYGRRADPFDHTSSARHHTVAVPLRLAVLSLGVASPHLAVAALVLVALGNDIGRAIGDQPPTRDRKSTRLNSSHLVISYAVFC